MGTVYKAYDPLLARVVAVKVISGQFSTQPDLRERFFREARAVARLDHPNIVTVYDLGEEDGVPYLAMQFLEGRDLEHRMRSPEGMSLARKVEIGHRRRGRSRARARIGHRPPRREAGQRLHHRAKARSSCSTSASPAW